jgi:hypothetical protein
MKSNNLGIWMDYSHAYVIWQNNGEESIREVKNSTEGHVREKGQSGSATSWGFSGGSNNEYKANSILRNELKQYFKKLEQEIGSADELLLFGPTFAKTEFFHFLSQQKADKGKSIFIKKSDKLSSKMMQHFVDDFFVNTRSLTV